MYRKYAASLMHTLLQKTVYHANQ